MEQTSNNSGKKKGFSKGLIAVIIGAVLVIGGSAAAFVFLNISEKEKYFLAEKNTFDFITDKFEERYQPELDWLEQSEKNPTESAIELSAEYNDPSGITAGGLGMDPSQIINNSTVTLTSATDMENKHMATELKANFGGLEIDGINLYLTADKIMVGLPFINELLQLKDEDFGTLLHELDPQSFTGDESLNLEEIFEGSTGFLSEDDLEYFEEEYVEMIYNELPESAFESSDDTIQVNDESLNTEKITMHLTEQQLKELATKVFDKMQKDEKLKELIRDQFAFPQFGGGPMESEIDQVINDFEAAMAEAKEEVDNFHIPNGLTSAIWVYDDLIAQREFHIEMGPSADDLVSFSVDATQLLTNGHQFFNYDIGFSDSYDEGTLTIAGDLSWEDNQAQDSIKLTVEDMELSYGGTESLNNGTRDFERVFTMNDTFAAGSLIWNGNFSYDKDQMSSEHNLSVESPDIDQNMFALYIMVDGKTISQVDMPEEDNVKDLGKMNVNELMEYMELEVTPQFQQWMFGILAGSGGF
ncbi:hypothetical protein QGM71_00565 [Virgibacillus sp. C22-A2]|uniref:DUF945 family protein n=1 Tax=Virgibacillus tibetensis TaxID=3042313 RepID=A0ABU6K9W2_9BACI|nr:hypothetical protein [Virgibacillus sp. C22-A2]